MTRERLLAAARELFRKQGYATTSIERIAEAAGYSKGAVYSKRASLLRYQKFESISLQRRVCEPLVPQRRSQIAGKVGSIRRRARRRCSV